MGKICSRCKKPKYLKEFRYIEGCYSDVCNVCLNQLEKKNELAKKYRSTEEAKKYKSSYMKNYGQREEYNKQQKLIQAKFYKSLKGQIKSVRFRIIKAKTEDTKNKLIVKLEELLKQVEINENRKL